MHVNWWAVGLLVLGAAAPAMAYPMNNSINYNQQYQQQQQQQLQDVQRQGQNQGQVFQNQQRPGGLQPFKPGDTPEPFIQFRKQPSIGQRLENAQRQAIAEANQAAKDAQEAQAAADKRASNIKWGGALVLLMGAGAIGLRFKGAKPKRKPPPPPRRQAPKRPTGRP
ncbi:MAG: hypothetical protein JWM80_2257 [Cyanobacteria bacterium RYN_339]|nr:hypothetical protein [Cyanobacteria bacterium RYN_339]